ncbi:MAG: hypothetical protein ACPGJE_02025 [Wenzhouxiangellaceae bacterium]
MLPITTHHRGFHIPHTLALAAAAVALVAALGWNASTPEPVDEPWTGGVRTTLSHESPEAEPEPAETARESHGNCSGRSCLTEPISGLLPLVLPSRAGR